MSFRLVIELDNGKSMTAEVEVDSFVIGRSQKCDVVIPIEGLSRQHCQVEVNDGTIFVTDLESANGVYIDDLKIPANQKTRYHSTSKLTCGTAEIVEFSFIDHSPQLESFNPSATSSAPIKDSDKRTRSSSPRKKMGGSSDFEKKMSTVHPGVKGFLVIALLGVGIFVFNNIFENSQTDDDELYQMQHNANMKNKGNDGSVKTRNF